MGPLDDLIGKEIQIEIDGKPLGMGTINNVTDNGWLDIIDSTTCITDSYHNYMEKLKEKEEDNMENKYALINLYHKRKEEEIDKYYDNKIRVEKEKSEVLKTYNKIIASAEEELQKLYMMQFTDEELEILNNGGVVEAKELRKTQSEIEVYTSLDINELYKNKKCKEYDEERIKELKELTDKVELIKANLALASNKEEVEEILKRYEILDKNGKMEV